VREAQLDLGVGRAGKADADQPGMPTISARW
jgi:hypothetical protein